MRMGQAVRTVLVHGGTTCVLQTQFSSFTKFPLKVTWRLKGWCLMSCYSALQLYFVQSYFNGSNTFWTMKISSRQGQFEPMRVDYSARSGSLIGLSFRFS